MPDHRTQASPDQMKRVGRNARTDKVVVMSPAKRRQIDETIEELERAAQRIDEVRRLIRHPR